MRICKEDLVKIFREQASEDHYVVENFPTQLTKPIEVKGFMQVFNADEKGLFWEDAISYNPV